MHSTLKSLEKPQKALWRRSYHSLRQKKFCPEILFEEEKLGPKFVILLYDASGLFLICDDSHDLVSFVLFKKCENHPQRSVNFSKVAGFSVFSRFLNCANGTKSKPFQTEQQICILGDTRSIALLKFIGMGFLWGLGMKN